MLGVEEVRHHQPVGDQGRAGEHDRRHREHHHERHDEAGPDEQRHAVQRHAGGAELENRDDQLHRHRQTRHLGEGDHLRPDIGALFRREREEGQRNVGEAAGVGRDLDRERDQDHQPAEQVEPVAERVEPREGDFARAHHQRHQIDRKPLRDRHREQEHHHRAVSAEQLVVGVGPYERVFRPGQLRPHQHRQQPGEAEKAEAGHEVTDADRLVVGGAEPACPAARRRPGLRQLGFQVRPPDRPAASRQFPEPVEAGSVGTSSSGSGRPK
jgi:hypothetical protein